MKNLRTILLLFVFTSALIFACSSQTRKNEPWKENQLMNPADLSKTINDPASKQPLIFCIGPSGLIKNAIDIGPGKDKENIEKLKTALSTLSKDTAIVIYCGCCPFKDCPNVRPAFELLNQMNFTNHQLLNIPKNLKTDWIDLGYPMAAK